VRTFLVDLDGVAYLNSTALALLVRLKKRSIEGGYEFQLINVSSHVLDIMRTTRLRDYFFPPTKAKA
jgi:anti-anti-sigma factor